MRVAATVVMGGVLLAVTTQSVPWTAQPTAYRKGNVAHRRASAYAPEHTPAACRSAL